MLRPLHNSISREEIAQWLKDERPANLDGLWRAADEARRVGVGVEVHLRGLVELSNHCVRTCAYCGINAGNRDLPRYRMTFGEILECAREAVSLGYGTVVLQAGEDYGLERDWVSSIVRRIKVDTPLAVTLSLGERPQGDLAAWRDAGADRYLLRFETSNRALYDVLHPGRRGVRSDRFAILAALRALGYEVGSGVMVGIPGQTYDDLARDVEVFREIDLDMIGVGPYIPHPSTRLAQLAAQLHADDRRHAPNTEEMTYKVIALTRIVCPRANIPSTTALATLNRTEGRELGLQRGANVIMPNLTPVKYRALYEIYPAKACLYESAGDCGACVTARITSIGRKVGGGRGDSPNSLARRHAPAVGKENGR